MSPEEELLERLRGAGAIIGYAPMGDEVDVHSFLVENQILASGRSIIADKEVSPHDFAETLSRAHAGEKTCILIPGREFDQFGTRHGRGGGWYDRFLKGVPCDWVRVGVLSPSQFSEEKLAREAWDEPVDYLLIQDSGMWRVMNVGRRNSCV